MNIPKTSQTNPRILAYIRALQFFQQNPFETSFCGLSKQNALTLVQTYLEKFPSSDDAPINLLQHSDLLAGKNISKESVDFSYQLSLAIQNLVKKINEPHDARDSDNPLAPNNPSVLKFEEEVVKIAGNQNTPDRLSWLKANEGRRKILKDERWEKQNNAGEELGRQLLWERNQRIKIQLEKQRVEQETTAWERIGEALDIKFKNTDSLKNLSQSNQLQNIIIDAIDDTSGEDEFWEDLSASLYKPILRESFGKITPEERQEKIKQAYQEKIKQRLSQDAALASLSQNSPLIEEIVEAVPSRDLIQRSFLKFFDKKLKNATSEQDKREQIGGLLFGKLTMAAEEATAGIKTNLKNKGSLLSDAILETYYELQARGHNIINLSNQEINQLRSIFV